MSLLKVLIILPFLSVVASVAFAQQVLINEVQYQNKTTAFDSDNDTPDWVELYNAGTIKVNLKGYQLSDKESELTNYWKMPEVEINPGAFLTIFLSGKNKNQTEEIHANFKLKLLEDSLFLINPNGSIIDKVDAQCVPPDKSIGRSPDGVGAFKILAPTFGESNNSAQQYSINYQPDSLFISHSSGFYKQNIEIELTNKIRENKIVYTLDGDQPDFDNNIFEFPFLLSDISGNKNRFATKGDASYEPGNLISKANIVRAQVFSEGCPASNEISNTYFISATNAFDYNVPVVSIITDKDNLFDDETGIYVAGNNSNYRHSGKKWERPMHIEIYDTTGFAIVDQEGGMRIHGRGSRAYDQKSLRIYAGEKYGNQGFEYPFFNTKPHLTNFQTLILRNTIGWSGTYFKEELCQNLVKNMNVDYTAAQTVIVFINGEYWGIHSLRERHDQDYVENNYNVSAENIDIIGYDEEYLMIGEGDRIEYDRLMYFLENTHPDENDFCEGINRFFDVDNLIDYFVAQFYFANVDFVNNNTEMWRLKTDTSVWRYFFFDMDGSMYRLDYDLLAEYHKVDNDFHPYDDYATQILNTLLKNKQFQQKFQERFYYHLEHTFSAANVLKAINDYQKLYEPLVSEQIYRWNYPSAYNKWLNNVDMLRYFAVNRPLILYDQIEQSFGTPFSIYPNPSNGNFSIDFFENRQEKEITIYDITGRIVFVEKQFNLPLRQFTTNLSRGSYLLKIEIGSNSFTQKIQILS